MLKRPTHNRPTLPKVVIVCEGDVTEKIYFHGVRIQRRVQRARMELHLAVGVPMTVVHRAIEVKEMNARRNKLDNIDLSEDVWAVFDRDDFDRIPEAMALAKANGIKVAFSNPNFELFLLLHFQEFNREEHRDVVVRLLRRHIRGYDKSYDYDALGLHDLYVSAKKRAKTINERSRLRSGIPSPPYTSIERLIDYLRAF